MDKAASLFSHAIEFRDEKARIAVVTWAIHLFGWQHILQYPNLQPTAFVRDVGVCMRPSYEPSGRAYIAGCPVWRAPTGEHVFLTTHDDALWLVCDEEAPLRDVMSVIVTFSATIAQIKPVKQPRYICDMNDNGGIVATGEISTARTFDHLFFEQKDELLALLERFKTGSMYAEHLGEDNKLGILLCGPPGTGKTATVAAIANYLGRNAVPLTSKQILNRKTMTHAFKNRTHVVVMDEFDVLLDVVKKRGSDVAPVTTSGGSFGTGMRMDQAVTLELLKLAAAEKDAGAKADLMKQYEASKDTDTTVDYAFLLSKMQGIESANGRIIVAMTNRPDDIDDAFKRKGRFDIVLTLGLCTPRMIMDMVCDYNGVDARGRETLECEFPALPCNALSPATVQDIEANVKASDPPNSVANARAALCEIMRLSTGTGLDAGTDKGMDKGMDRGMGEGKGEEKEEDEDREGLRHRKRKGNAFE